MKGASAGSVLIPDFRFPISDARRPTPDARCPMPDAEIHRYYIAKAHAAGIRDATPGSIAFTQRWGSALNPFLTA